MSVDGSGRDSIGAGVGTMVGVMVVPIMGGTVGAMMDVAVVASVGASVAAAVGGAAGASVARRYHPYRAAVPPCAIFASSSSNTFPAVSSLVAVFIFCEASRGPRHLHWRPAVFLAYRISCRVASLVAILLGVCCKAMSMSSRPCPCHGPPT